MGSGKSLCAAFNNEHILNDIASQNLTIVNWWVIDDESGIAFQVKTLILFITLSASIYRMKILQGNGLLSWSLNENYVFGLAHRVVSECVHCQLEKSYNI